MLLTTVLLPIYGLFFRDLSEEPAFLQNLICLVRCLISSTTMALAASTSQCIFYVPIPRSCFLQMSLSAAEEAPSPQTTTFYVITLLSDPRNSSQKYYRWCNKWVAVLLWSKVCHCIISYDLWSWLLLCNLAGEPLQPACVSKHESYSLSRECFAAQGALISLISNFTFDYILLQAQQPLHYSWHHLAILSVFSGFLWCMFPNFDFLSRTSIVSKQNLFLTIYGIQ